MTFTPYHINATLEDLAGNQGIGRYVLLPGSDGRAKEMAEQLTELKINTHPRGHHLYCGKHHRGTEAIDVAIISSGMGCPSMEIILHELYHLGARRFLRVGTAGSLQPSYIPIGSIINVQASVRDESTTRDYAPIEVPAIASLHVIQAVQNAASALDLGHLLHTGSVHCKSSFYAREFGEGPLASTNEAYLELLTANGILASEMETAALLIQSQYYNQQVKLVKSQALDAVYAGAILGIIAIPPHAFADKSIQQEITIQLIQLAFESLHQLHHATAA